MTSSRANTEISYKLDALLGELEDMTIGSKEILGLLYEKMQEYDGPESVQLGAMLSAIIGTLNTCISRIDQIDGILEEVEITARYSESIKIYGEIAEEGVSDA